MLSVPLQTVLEYVLVSALPLSSYYASAYPTKGAKADAEGKKPNSYYGLTQFEPTQVSFSNECNICEPG